MLQTSTKMTTQVLSLLFKSATKGTRFYSPSSMAKHTILQSRPLDRGEKSTPYRESLLRGKPHTEKNEKPMSAARMLERTRATQRANEHAAFSSLSHSCHRVACLWLSFCRNFCCSVCFNSRLLSSVGATMIAVSWILPSIQN